MFALFPLQDRFAEPEVGSLSEAIAAMKQDALIRRQTKRYVRDSKCQTEEGNVLFNNAIDTFYLRLYSIERVVKGHSEVREETLCMNYALQCSSKWSVIYGIP